MIKKRNYFAFILTFIIIISSFSLTSCSDDDESNPLDSLTDRERAFVGTWNLNRVLVTDENGTVELTPNEANLSFTIVVNSDKSYSINGVEEGVTISENGTWSINGSFILLNSNSGGTSLFDYTVDGNTFTIEIEIRDPSQDNILIRTEVREFIKS